MVSKRHKVFISFYHGFPLIDHHCGQKYKEHFEKIFGEYHGAIISKSVQNDDIKDGLETEATRQKIRDGYIADATVAVVLIGLETWKREHVNWEISSSIRSAKNNSRCGLTGILLPTYRGYDKVKNTYDPYTIPPRLYEKSIHVWNENPLIVQEWIYQEFLRRDKINPVNSFPMLKHNRAADQTKW